MELVRGQQVGVFDQQLFSSAITAIMCSSTAGPEALQLLTSKYLAYVDVR